MASSEDKGAGSTGRSHLVFGRWLVAIGVLALRWVRPQGPGVAAVVSDNIWGRPERGDDGTGAADRLDQVDQNQPVGETGQTDELGPLDELRSERHEIRRGRDGWTDPRDWLTAEERATYFLRHEPMSDAEIARLEAENAAHGYTYEPGLFEDLFEDDDARDGDGPAAVHPDRHAEGDPPADDSTAARPEAPDHQAEQPANEPADTEDSGRAAEPAGSPGRHAAMVPAHSPREDQGIATLSDNGEPRLNDPVRDGPWHPERRPVREQTVRFGDQVVNEENDRRSLRQKVHDTIVRNTEDVITRAEQGANRAQLAMNPRPAGAHAEVRPEPPVVAETHRGEASLGTVLASGIAAAVAASVIVDRTRTKKDQRTRGTEDAGDG